MDKTSYRVLTLTVGCFLLLSTTAQQVIAWPCSPSSCGDCYTCTPTGCEWDCSPGATCCNDSCCNSANCCNSTTCCSNSDDVCCTDADNAYCCESDETCCNGSCCSAGQCCSDGTCVTACPDVNCSNYGDCTVDDYLSPSVSPENYNEIGYYYGNLNCCPEPNGFTYYVTIFCSGAGLVIPDCNSSDPNLATVTSDPNGCFEKSSVKFKITTKQGRPPAKATVTCSAVFYAPSGDNCHVDSNSKTITINIEPSQGECCEAGGSGGDGILLGPSVGNAYVSVQAGTNPADEFSSAKILDYGNGEEDIAIQLPGRAQFYILSRPSSFAPGWLASMEDNNDVTVTSPDDLKYIYPENSNYMLTKIIDTTDANVVTFDYNDTNPDLIDTQSDGFDPNLYIEYEYDGGLLKTLTAWDYSDSREYTITYDENNRVIAMSNSCTECGGGGFKYEFDANDLLQSVEDANEDVIYEYVYDSNGRITDKYLGLASNGNHIQRFTYTDSNDGSCIVDINDYIDSGNYRVTREYRNSAGLVTKRIRHEDLNEEPDDPDGFIEHIVYYYNAKNTITKKVVIPPLGDSNDPDPGSISGIRKEYTYDPNTSRMLTEKWFDVNDVNFTLVSYTYENTPDGKNVRVKYSTDARGATTEYFYDGNSVDPNLKAMPQVTSGISGTKQLQYAYEYDIRNRVSLEKQLDVNDVVIVQTKYEYDNYGNLEKRLDDYGDSNEPTEYEYNGFNEMVKMTLPSDVVQGWSYNDNGKVEYEAVLDPCDPNNNAYSQTVYYYDEMGRVEKIKKADDPNVFPIGDPNNWIWTEYEYDLRGNKTKVIEDVNGLELETTYEYNNQGEVKKVTLPNGKWTKTYRDGRGLVAYTVVGYGETTEATTTFYYDGNGNLEEQITPDGVSTTYEYDDFDRLNKITRGL